MNRRPPEASPKVDTERIVAAIKAMERLIESLERARHIVADLADALEAKELTR